MKNLEREISEAADDRKDVEDKIASALREFKKNSQRYSREKLQKLLKMVLDFNYELISEN